MSRRQVWRCEQSFHKLSVGLLFPWIQQTFVQEIVSSRLKPVELVVCCVDKAPCSNLLAPEKHLLVGELDHHWAILSQFNSVDHLVDLPRLFVLYIGCNKLKDVRDEVELVTRDTEDFEIACHADCEYISAAIDSEEVNSTEEKW